MKLLLFSDVHCDIQRCEKLVQRSESVDVVIGAGDIGLLRKGLKKTIAVLRQIRKPTVLVPGNSESFTTKKLPSSGRMRKARCIITKRAT